jgi:hypothetical protein
MSKVRPGSKKTQLKDPGSSGSEDPVVINQCADFHFSVNKFPFIFCKLVSLCMLVVTNNISPCNGNYNDTSIKIGKSVK